MILCRDKAKEYEGETPMKYRDHPIDECRKTLDEMLAINPMAKAFQKFTCNNCGDRLTIDVPNKFFSSGKCDKCGHITDIKKHGCNFMLHLPRVMED